MGFIFILGVIPEKLRHGNTKKKGGRGGKGCASSFFGVLFFSMFFRAGWGGGGLRDGNLFCLLDS